MERDTFEKIVEESFNLLPNKFKEAIENLGVIVEDFPDDDLVRQLKLPSKHHLLGLYQGIPLTKRGTWYGNTPVPPDKISLYQRNIEAECRTNDEVRAKVHEVLLHEIGHYFGMSEAEIRAAGY